MAPSKTRFFFVAISLAAFLLIGSGCTMVSEAPPGLPPLPAPPNIPVTSLPVAPPADFSIEWRSGGGMRPDGTTIRLVGKEGHRTERVSTNGELQTIESDFTLSDADFADLYAFLRNEAADRLVIDDGQVYDGTNDGYTLYWEGKSFYAWGLMVNEADRARFQEIYTHMATVFADAR